MSMTSPRCPQRRQRVCQLASKFDRLARWAVTAWEWRLKGSVGVGGGEARQSLSGGSMSLRSKKGSDSSGVTTHSDLKLGGLYASGQKRVCAPSRTVQS